MIARLREFWRESTALALSLLVHAIAGFLFVYGLPLAAPERVEPVRIVNAVFLDTSREKLGEQRRVEEQRRAEEAERQRQEEARKRAAERARKRAAEEAKRKAEEAKRKAEEELRRREELERARAEAEAEALRKAEEEKARRKAEAEAAEQRRKDEEVRKKAEAERRRKEEQARQAEQRQRELAAAMAAEEEALQAAQDASDRQRYVQAIARHVRSRWVRPAGVQGDFRCRVEITQLPGGQIANVALLDSCGNSFLDASVENAVRKSDPLPLPDNPRVFERKIIFSFEPE